MHFISVVKSNFAPKILTIQHPLLVSIILNDLTSNNPLTIASNPTQTQSNKKQVTNKQQ